MRHLDVVASCYPQMTQCKAKHQTFSCILLLKVRVFHHVDPGKGCYDDLELEMGATFEKNYKTPAKDSLCAKCGSSGKS